mgnify:CR=1 FL=1
MKKVIYDVNVDGLCYTSIVYETKRQKDILDVLDCLFDNSEQYGWAYTFEDDSFFIEYTDGTTYEASECGEYGIYKKKGIKKIIYVNANDTQVYGGYEVNEYGNVA